MKLRYQMRGLGIGIIVTALLMGVATREKIPLSDAEIRAKALALGMVESNSLKLTDIQNTAQPSGTTQPPGMAEGAGDAGSGDSSGTEDVSGDRSGGDSSGTGAEDASGDGGGVQPSGTLPEEGSGGDGGGEPSETEPVEAPGSTGSGIIASDGETVTIYIEKGITSYGVSQIIAEAGLVEDAFTFDRYLCEQGYSRKIDMGTHVIPIGSTEEEIAKIITKDR